MYAIIYWVNNVPKVYPKLTRDFQLETFESSEEADGFADAMEERAKDSDEILETRVISIEGVKE